MKKILILNIIISFTTLLHAQGVANKVETQEVRETINKMLGDVESSKNNPLSLNHAIKTLSDQLLNNWNTKVYVSCKVAGNFDPPVAANFDPPKSKRYPVRNKTNSSRQEGGHDERKTDKRSTHDAARRPADT